jgi:hypothetical protein
VSNHLVFASVRSDLCVSIMVVFLAMIELIGGYMLTLSQRFSNRCSYFYVGPIQPREYPAGTNERQAAAAASTPFGSSHPNALFNRLFHVRKSSILAYPLHDDMKTV